jgi:hypothetical protein
MTDFQQQAYRSGERTAGTETPPLDGPEARADGPVSGIPPPREDDPTILGFPAVADVDDGGGDRAADGRDTSTDRQAPPVEAGLDPPVRLVVLRRADPVAGIALVLAGVAAAASLWLPWRQGNADTGLSLVWRGLRVAGSGMGQLGATGLWQPLVIVLGGGLLLLLGVLLFLPERTHRFVGVQALFVATGAAAAVLFQVAQAEWSAARFDRGMWCAVAVGVLGVLGALKAMLTAPRVTAKPRRAARR